MKIIASMIESAQWQAWLSQQHSPFSIVTNSKKPCTDEVTIIAAPCSLAEIDSDLLDYDELLIHIWGLQATLANALRNGAEEAQIESVVAKWVETSEQLLAWLPKYQHKVNLLSHAHATYFTQDWCEWLNNLGIEWPQADINTTCARTSQDEYDLFAAYYVKTHPQLERLEQLLLSVALPMGEDYPQLPLSIAELTRQSQHAIRRQRYTDKQLTERESDIDQLRQERAAEKMKFEQQLAENQQAHDVAISAAAQQKTALEEQLKATEQQQQALAQENELVITDLHRVQEALETALQQHQQQTDKCSTLEQQLLASREQQAKLEQSLADQKDQHTRLNEQYTTSQVALKTSEQQQQALAQENDLVITELHRVQEALEASLQHNQQVMDKCNALEQSLTEQQDQHNSLSEQYATSQFALQASEQQKSALEQKVNDATRQQKALEQENSMIIAELLRVQETHETLYYEKTTLQQQIELQVQQLKAHSAKINSLIKRQRLTKLELAQALASKTLLEKELTAHHASTLWKMTVPVRKFRQTPQRKRAAQLAQQKLLIEFSEYFDREWYLAQYPDVIEDGVEPIEHYLRFGAQEGRNPSAEFNTLWYLKTYPDVAESGLNPLVHFIQYGEREERKCKQLLIEDRS
ncbi:hypothetical protein CAG58_09870 [Vibrio sp. V31_P5A7T61]|uniref:hypothetical protein n=1 Tax=unclassified Vibrio TaxID=2614977 RepID=UPI00137312F3|nr:MULTISPECIES: hypothetical protein [unclassified Vibrio]NAW62243.1 hypothetical protein [Vibrio sp. V31_P5A7T61]NAX01115.1 hypothetical protein [Vibrio sp. V34_P3A8T189]NAX08506.1 hypothetical protein [Vibrio sp. V40_P2S30T141]NAX62336.1 hypothetical protein [Vibrio sp. V32_P6A28T40]